MGFIGFTGFRVYRCITVCGLVQQVFASGSSSGLAKTGLSVAMK